MRVVVTRPLEDAERTAAALRARGHEVLIAPLLKVEPVDGDLFANWGGIILTSANAAQAIGAHPARQELIGLPLFAVGRRTAEAAQQAGFSSIEIAGGSVRDLLRMLVARRAQGQAPLLYLAGEDRALDIVGELRAQGIVAEMAVVYRAAAVPFPAALVVVLKSGEVDAVLHFSRRSADSYVAGAAAAGVTGEALEVRHICLSAQVALPLTGAGAVKVAVAPRPEEAALIELLGAPEV